MKPRLLLLVFCLVCHQAVAQEIEVYFSPKGGCTEAVVKELDAAKATVLVEAYSFTSAPKITERNLIHYATRDQAIKAGKRPCAECRP